MYVPNAGGAYDGFAVTRSTIWAGGPIICPEQSQAVELAGEIMGRIPPEVAIGLMGSHLNVDLHKFPHDMKLSELRGQVTGGQSLFESHLDTGTAEEAAKHTGFVHRNAPYRCKTVHRSVRWRVESMQAQRVRGSEAHKTVARWGEVESPPTSRPSHPLTANAATSHAAASTNLRTLVDVPTWVAPLLEQAPHAATLRSADGELLWANDAYLHLLGRSLEELLGTTPEALTGKSMSDRYHASVRDGEQRTEVSRSEMTYLRSDGTEVAVEIQHHPLCSDDDGQIEYFFSYITDVSAREDVAMRLELEDLTSTMAARFVDLDDDDLASGVAEALRQVASYFDAELIQIWDLADGSESLVEAFRYPVRAPAPHQTMPVDHAPESRNAAVGDSLRSMCEPESEPADAELHPVTIELMSNATQDQRSLIEALSGQSSGDFGSCAIVPIRRGSGDISVLVLSTALPRRWSRDRTGTLATVLALLSDLRSRSADQAYFATAFDMSPVGVSIRDMDLQLIEANTAYADFLGYSKHELPDIEAGTPLILAEDLGLMKAALAEVRETGSTTTEQIRYRHKSGAVAMGRLTARTISRADSDKRYLLSYLEDITESTTRAEALRRSEERLRSIFEHSPAIIVLLDQNRSITFINHAIESMGFPVDYLIGKRLLDLDWEPLIEVDAIVQRVFATGEDHRFKLEALSPIGRRWLDVSAVPEISASGDVTGVILLAQDDTERHLSQMELEHRARFDDLTGLHNRSALMEAIESTIAEQEQPDAAAVLFIDLDRFKLVNDSLGHDAGDALLMEVAERFRQSVRSGDVVSRIGGDEFVIMLRGPVGRSDVQAAAQRIKDAMIEPIDLFGNDLFVTMSIGIAFPRIGDDMNDVLRHADIAMYHAKERGRNRFEIFDEELEQQVDARVRLESAMRQALPNGEFELHFMPEINMTNGEHLSMEALLRWNHPDMGQLAAGSFVELAEETGLIVDIGAWVIDEACRVGGEWSRDPSLPNIDMRVNLSARQISHPGIIDQIEQAYLRSGFDPRRLCVEITETAFMHEPDAAMETLGRLRSLGIELAVDDFGTGWASLTYVKQFPVSVLKIDRSFVEGVADNPEDSAIIQSQVSLAHAMGLEVVAEGVERQDQADALLAMGVWRAQGYLYGEPQPREIAEANLRQNARASRKLRTAPGPTSV